MLQTLYSVLDPLVTKKAHGALEIEQNTTRKKGILFLVKGKIVRIKVGDFSGKQAAMVLTGWVNLSSRFRESVYPNSFDIVQISTMKFLAALKKVEAIISNVNGSLPQLNAIYKFDVNRVKGELGESNEDLNLLLMFTGNKSLRDLIKETDHSELHVLLKADHYRSKNWIVPIIGRPVKLKRILDRFVAPASAVLANMIGPAAEVIVQRARRRVDPDPTVSMQDKIAALVEKICESLEPDDQLEFKQWTVEWVKANISNNNPGK